MIRIAVAIAVAVMMGPVAAASALIVHCTPTVLNQNCADLGTEPVAPGQAIVTVLDFALQTSVKIDSVVLTGVSASWPSSSSLVGNRLTITATNIGVIAARLTGGVTFEYVPNFVARVDFETGNLFQARNVQTCQALGTCATSSMPVVTSPARSGTYAAHAVCDIADPPVLGHTHRSEVIVGPTVVGEYWYGWSTFIPNTWSTDDSACSTCSSVSHYHLISQWHTTTEACQPLQLNAHDNILQWEHYLGDCGPGAVFTILWQDTNLAAYKGVWVDWVVHANWLIGPGGYVDIWKNGVQIVHYAPTQLMSSDSLGTYLKGGVTYDVDESHDVYVDEFRMMDSTGDYASVAPH